MGTTAVALLLGVGESISIAHVGDSRAYRMRDGELQQITEDHSWVGEEVRQNRLAAEDAESHPMKNVLLRSLGVTPEVEVAVQRQPVRPGDRFMLCSDGLWGEVRSPEISEIMAHSDAPAAVRELVDLANRNGGSDNVTVMVAIVQDGESESILDDETTEPQTESVTLPIEPVVRGASGAKSGLPYWAGPVLAFGAGLLVILLVWASL